MLISIITSTYNSDSFLEEALISYKKQTYQNKELIIIDGASTDNTLAIINRHKDVYSFLLSEKDKGIYDALNKGIINSSGEVIGILHSDDLLYDDDVLSDVSEIFDKNPAVGAVYGNLVYVDRDNPNKIVRKWVSKPYKLNRLCYGWMPPHPALFIRKECFSKLGSYDLQYKSAADYDLILRFLYKYKIRTAYLPKTLVKMRVGGVSNRSIKNRWRANKEDRLAMRKNGIRFPLIISFIKPLRKVVQFLK